jgi:hypothetical protein
MPARTYRFDQAVRLNIVGSQEGLLVFEGSDAAHGLLIKAEHITLLVTDRSGAEIMVGTLPVEGCSLVISGVVKAHIDDAGPALMIELLGVPAQ